MTIKLKRAYDTAEKSDGYRVLVDRLWPRGVKKETLGIDEWCKAISPTAELRKWFGHLPDRFEEFTARYTDELASSTEPRRLLGRAKTDNVLTLVYAAKDPKVNHAVVLKKYLEELV